MEKGALGIVEGLLRRGHSELLSPWSRGDPRALFSQRCIYFPVSGNNTPITFAARNGVGPPCGQGALGPLRPSLPASDSGMEEKQRRGGAATSLYSGWMTQSVGSCFWVLKASLVPVLSD